MMSGFEVRNSGPHGRSPDRQATLERLATALKDRWFQIADTEVIGHHLSRAWEQLADAALAAVEQAAPEGQSTLTTQACADCSVAISWDAEPEPLCDECVRDRYHDAREALREAATWAKNSHAVVEGQHRHYDRYSIDCAACQWLALPAVVAAMKEEKG